MLKDFKEFVVRGNVVDMAVGIVIGAAFGAIVKSFVDDVLMPPMGLLLGNVDFANLFITLKEGAKAAGPYASLAAAKAAGAVTLNLGSLHQHRHQLSHHRLCRLPGDQGHQPPETGARGAPAAPDTRACPFCLSEIPLQATRCPHCTSEVAAPPA